MVKVFDFTTLMHRWVDESEISKAPAIPDHLFREMPEKAVEFLQMQVEHHRSGQLAGMNLIVLEYETGEIGPLCDVLLTEGSRL